MSEPVQVYTACQFVNFKNFKKSVIQCPKHDLLSVIYNERAIRG